MGLRQVGHLLVIVTHCSMHSLQKRCAHGVMVRRSISERHTCSVVKEKEKRMRKCSWILHKDLRWSERLVAGWTQSTSSSHEPKS